MKRILPFLLTICTMTALADDIIVLRTSEKINAKILEVSENEIKYKKANYLEGPTFILPIENISNILFENGDIQMYNIPLPKEEKTQSYFVKSDTNNDDNNNDEYTANNKSGGWRFAPTDKKHIGISIGYLSRNWKYGGRKYAFLGAGEDKLTSGLRFGLLANPTSKYGIGVRTGVFMEYCHEKFSHPTYPSYDVKVDDITFSTPLQLSFRMEVARKFSLMLYTGPVFDFGAWQQIKVGDEKTGNLYDKDIAGEYIGFNCLWGVGGGLQYSFLRLEVGGEFGLVKKGDLNGDKTARWNKPVYVSLSFMF